MKIFVYYSINHDCFKCEYIQITNYPNYGHIDKFNRLWLKPIYLKEKTTFSEKIKIRKRYRGTFKERLSRRLFQLSVKLNPPNNQAYKIAPKYPWWKL